MNTLKKKTITTVLIRQEKSLSLPGDYPLKEDEPLKENGALSLKGSPFPFSPETAYGCLKDLYAVWKRVRAEWICFNWGEEMPLLTEELFGELSEGKSGMIVTRVYCRTHLQEHHRSQFYSYDFRMLLSVMKKRCPAYYRHGVKKVFNASELYLPSAVMKKKDFDRFCGWMFPLLKECGAYLSPKCSALQEKYLEHLAPYLFTLYVSFHEETLRPAFTPPLKLEAGEKESGKVKGEKAQGEKAVEEPRPDDEDLKREQALALLSGWMEKREVEKAVRFALAIPEKRKDLSDIRALFARYERERRYEKDTVLDRERDWKRLLKKPEEFMPSATRKGARKLLIFEWASIGRKVNSDAFRRLGFECHTFEAPYKRYTFDEACLEQINRHLDFHSFDLVFSMNCNGMVAEACYIHNIPYLAWCYDPSFAGGRWYLRYPTTHVFTFDSSDAESFRRAGFENAHYLPLAVSADYFAQAACAETDREKYGAEISFIGSLYDSTLPEAMGYLTDYQKGYLNALIDNQLDVYGHSFYPEILSPNFMDWLDNPGFNQCINSHWDKEEAGENASLGRLQLLLNQQVTNKERLLLLNLLAKHHEVKLYSYKNSEALQNLTYCGTADYYTEMPKIFRLSRINLNATLRSIKTGIPLRCLDIMACGGLLLTNYQKDFEDHFKDGENLLFYADAGEALEKADFYLAHEELRKRIARAGCETVKEFYSYPVRIREMFEMAGLSDMLPKEGR